jgi:hypothetical protein
MCNLSAWYKKDVAPQCRIWGSHGGEYEDVINFYQTTRRNSTEDSHLLAPQCLKIKFFFYHMLQQTTPNILVGGYFEFSWYHLQTQSELTFIEVASFLLVSLILYEWATPFLILVERLV